MADGIDLHRDVSELKQLIERLRLVANAAMDLNDARTFDTARGLQTFEECLDGLSQALREANLGSSDLEQELDGWLYTERP